MSDATEAGLIAIRALRKRLADLEALAAQQAQSPPTDKPATVNDALRRLARDGSASGPAVDRLRRQITEGPPVSESPDPGRLAEATRTVLDGLGGSGTIEGAYSAMKATARRRDVVEDVSPGGLGRIDPLNQASATAIDKIRRALSEEH